MEEMSLDKALFAGEMALRKEGLSFSPDKPKLAHELFQTRGKAGTLILPSGRTDYNLINFNAPPEKQSNSTAEELWKCVEEHYGLTAMTAASSAGAIPLSKIWLGYPVYGTSSRFTNPISHLGHQFYPKAILASGSPAARTAKAIFGTKRIFGILGRANIPIAIGFAIFDVISIAKCLNKKED